MINKVFFLVVVSFLVLTACSSFRDQSETEQVFYFSGIPDQNISKWANRYTVLEDYLSADLGIKVKGIPAKDYSSVIVAFEQGNIQMGWFGGLSGVQARLEVPGSSAFAQRQKDREFHSVFIARKDVNAKSIEDLGNLTFTFGSENSTSGHLMPRYYLNLAGIDPEIDFNGLPSYSGSHDKTWLMVQTGAFQAGALSESVWKSRIAEGKIDLNKVTEISRTPAYYDYNWTIRPGLDDYYGSGFEQKLIDSILNISDSEILELFNTKGFVPTNNDNYLNILDIAVESGIIK